MHRSDSTEIATYSTTDSGLQRILPQPCRSGGLARTMSIRAARTSTQRIRWSRRATGDRELQAGAWLAAPGMRSEILLAPPTLTPHGAEDSAAVVEGRWKRLEYFAVS